MNLTPSEKAVIEQLYFLSNHFRATHGLECFSQSVGQMIRFFKDKQGYTRRTIQNALRKLESLGLIDIAYNQGYKGANLFYVHHDKYEELLNAALEASTKACAKVKEIFKGFIKLTKTLAPVALEELFEDKKGTPLEESLNGLSMTK
ncbi:hypothetical protein [Vibrio parahaemolyticus]|uniref:hypothetical protein n=1 Tax=Vibrio parahaemolyticus TaxID=670 RepID=UPI001EC0C927|nr:hypothetical protein [Vibrio parahaemolyticus]EID0057178.1 hypothetical protein [Vibrio parahaemolyticus]ELK3867010.1 hypothetical protein [Vibrio parahaemolyticus]ELZ1477443.1 hypothetical protein [Vibrio parahaemolyticus]